MNVIKHSKVTKVSIGHKEVKHDGITYPCTLCEYKTQYKSLLGRHTETMHGQGVRNKRGIKLSCVECAFETVYKHSFTQHVHVTHGNVAYSL